MKSILFSNCVIVFSFVLVYGQEKEALIFDRFTRSLFDLPNEIEKNVKCGAWAVACPAETSAEKDFIRQYSSTKNALFVRAIHEKGNKASEIYYKFRDVDYFHDDNIDDYKNIEKAMAQMTTAVKKVAYKAGEYKRLTQNAIGNDSKELWFNQNRKMGFTWIEMVKFGFDIPKRILGKMLYNISVNSRWPVEGERCVEYGLGNELYKDTDVDKLYTNEVKDIFQRFTLPEKLKCNSNKECFDKTLIIPVDQFRFGSSTPPLCSNLATIPLWKNTLAVKSLERVDRFLYSLYKVQGQPLHIIAGISSFHEYPVSKWRKAHIYLHPEKKKIPIPKVIYKIVEYRVKNCKLEETKCWYSAVIVIHNDPFLKSSERICSDDTTSQWGWLGIRGNEDKAKDTVYVCPRNKTVMNKLLESSKNAESQGLKLSNFPYSSDGEKIIPRSIVVEVKDMFTNFEEKGEDLIKRGEKIMELAQMDFENPDDIQESLTEESGLGTVEAESEKSD